jgi:hypothetical protein
LQRVRAAITQPKWEGSGQYKVSKGGKLARRALSINIIIEYVKSRKAAEAPKNIIAT